MLYSRRMHVCGHQEDRVSIRYCDTFGARRPPSSQALPSDQVFHEKNRARYARAVSVICTGLQCRARIVHVGVVLSCVHVHVQCMVSSEMRWHSIEWERRSVIRELSSAWGDT